MCTVFLNSKYGTTKMIGWNVYFLLFHYLNFPLIVLLHFTSLLHDHTDLKPACKHDLPHFSFMALANPISRPLTNIQSPLTYEYFSQIQYLRRNCLIPGNSTVKTLVPSNIFFPFRFVQRCVYPPVTTKMTPKVPLQFCWLSVSNGHSVLLQPYCCSKCTICHIYVLFQPIEPGGWGAWDPPKAESLDINVQPLWSYQSCAPPALASQWESEGPKCLCGQGGDKARRKWMW